MHKLARNQPPSPFCLQDWVPLGELAEGEQLRGASGPAIVLTATILPRSLPVYNIEVHGEHVYQVGTLGLLVHNAGSCTFITNLNGKTFSIPRGWTIRTANNGKGLVAQAPGAAGNANMVRIMDATKGYPQGYLRYYNKFGQPINPLTGKPGTQAQAHVDLSSFIGELLGYPN